MQDMESNIADRLGNDNIDRRQQESDRLKRVADDVARAVIQTFYGLPAKYKPRTHDPSKEWTVLSGIVLETEHQPKTCVALATGTKCLPHEKMKKCKGVTVHDSHAEVLAIRAFNRFLLDECHKPDSPWVEYCGKYKEPNCDNGRIFYMSGEWELGLFQLQHDVSIFMYCSEMPCGDASMELTMQAQPDTTPWAAPNNSNAVDEQGEPLSGREHFDRLGEVRPKPGRGDAPRTKSKSCSDKLALKQGTSMLNAITSLVISPFVAYLDSLIVPHEQYEICEEAVERCWGLTGRFTPFADWESNDFGLRADYHFVPFDVLPTTVDFQYSLDSIPSDVKPIAYEVSTIWTPFFTEALINGTLQGRKQFEPLGASEVSRYKIWKAALKLLESRNIVGGPLKLLRDPKHYQLPEWPTAGQHRPVKLYGEYGDMKEAIGKLGRDDAKRTIKDAVLQLWERNDGDDKWKTEHHYQALHLDIAKSF